MIYNKISLQTVRYHRWPQNITWAQTDVSHCVGEYCPSLSRPER